MSNNKSKNKKMKDKDNYNIGEKGLRLLQDTMYLQGCLLCK